MSNNPIITISKRHHESGEFIYTFTRKNGAHRYKTTRVIDLKKYFKTWTKDSIFTIPEYHIGNNKVNKLTEAQTTLMVKLHPDNQIGRRFNSSTARKLAQYGYIRVNTSDYRDKIYLSAKGRDVARIIVAKQDAELEEWKNQPEQIATQKLLDERKIARKAAELSYYSDYGHIAPQAKFEVTIPGRPPIVTNGEFVRLNWHNDHYKIAINDANFDGSPQAARQLASDLIETANLTVALNIKHTTQEQS